MKHTCCNICKFSTFSCQLASNSLRFPFKEAECPHTPKRRHGPTDTRGRRTSPKHILIKKLPCHFKTLTVGDFLLQSKNSNAVLNWQDFRQRRKQSTDMQGTGLHRNASISLSAAQMEAHRPQTYDVSLSLSFHFPFYRISL